MSLLSTVLTEQRGKIVALHGEDLDGLLSRVLDFDDEWLVVRTPDGTRRTVRLSTVHSIEDGENEERQYDLKVDLMVEFGERSYAASAKRERARLVSSLGYAEQEGDEPRPAIDDPEGFLARLQGAMGRDE